MHIHITDQYRPGYSVVHRLDPRAKIIVAVLFILAVSLTPFGVFWAYALLYALLIVAALSSGIGMPYMLRRSFIAIPFALAAVTLPFTVPGETLVTVPVLGGLDVTIEGTVRFASIMVKSWISVQMAILLVAVTLFTDLLWGLRALRLPGPLVTIVGFTYRYLFVLSDEAMRLMRARSARSASAEGRPSGKRLLWQGKVTGRMVGSLLLRSLERSERIYQAMLARGYDGQLRTLSHPRMRRQDYLVLLISATLLFLVVFAARFLNQ